MCLLALVAGLPLGFGRYEALVGVRGIGCRWYQAYNARVVEGYEVEGWPLSKSEGFTEEVAKGVVIISLNKASKLDLPLFRDCNTTTLRIFVLRVGAAGG